MIVTKPKIDGNKSWLFGSLLASLGVGPQILNPLLSDEVIGVIPQTPVWMLVGVSIALLLSVAHKVQKILDRLPPAV